MLNSLNWLQFLCCNFFSFFTFSSFSFLLLLGIGQLSEVWVLLWVMSRVDEMYIKISQSVYKKGKGQKGQSAGCPDAFSVGSVFAVHCPCSQLRGEGRPPSEPLSSRASDKVLMISLYLFCSEVDRATSHFFSLTFVYQPRESRMCMSIFTDRTLEKRKRNYYISILLNFLAKYLL